MSNLFDLKSVCAAYHGKTPDELVVGPTDLFLVAANNVRKFAEKQHNFELSWVRATLDVDYQNGALFVNATTLPADRFSNIKEVVSLQGQVNNCWYPIRFSRPRGIPETYDWIYPRYPNDGDVVPSTNIGLIIRGDNLYLYPNQTATGVLPIRIEGYGWLKDYTAAMLDSDSAPPQDYLIEFGFDFLQWSIIIELNYRFHTFVNRQEGNPGVPSTMQKTAWDALVDWDSYSLSPHLRDTR